MNGAPVGLLLAIGVAGLTGAALLNAAEAAALRVSRSTLAELAASNLPSARRVGRVMADPRGAAAAAGLLAVLLEVLALVCITLWVAAGGLSWWQVLLTALVVNTLASVLLVRFLPRRVGRRYPGGTIVATSGLLVLSRAVAAPLRRAAGATADQHDLTDDEIREMVDRVSESEHIEDEEREMFRSVLELGDTITRAVMVPRTEMITLPRGTPARKALSLFLRSGYSRVPVVGDSVDDLIGILYLKDVVRHSHAVAGSDAEPVDHLVRPPVFVPESKPVDDLLRDMQKGAFHMAVVVDEFGGIAGLVTIEDALEEIVGELTDEHDRAAPEVELLEDGAYRVPSRMPVDELGEIFDLDLEDEDVDTVGGLLAKALGKVPLSGSSAQVGGLVLTADRVEGRRKQIATLVVRRLAADHEPHDDRDGPPRAPRAASADQGAPR